MGDTCVWLSHRSDHASFHGCDRTYTPQRAPYKAIFHDRVGFAALVAVLLPWLHSAAFPAVLALLAVLCGLAVALIVRLVGGSRATALLAAGLLFTVRDATWLARVGSEAPALLGILGVVAGLLGTSKRLAPRRFVALSVVSGVWLLAVRPSTAVALGIAVLLVYGAKALARREWATDARIAAVAAVAASAITGEMQLRHSPGLTATLQDTFTHHFATVQMHSLRYEYGELVTRTAASLGHGLIHHSLTPLLAIAGATLAVSVARLRPAALCVILVAAASAVAHPVFTEIPRLLSPATSIEAIGFAIGASRVTTFTRRRRPSAAAKA